LNVVVFYQELQIILVEISSILQVNYQNFASTAILNHSFWFDHQ